MGRRVSTELALILNHGVDVGVDCFPVFGLDLSIQTGEDFLYVTAVLGVDAFREALRWRIPTDSTGHGSTFMGENAECAAAAQIVDKSLAFGICCHDEGFAHPVVKIEDKAGEHLLGGVVAITCLTAEHGHEVLGIGIQQTDTAFAIVEEKLAEVSGLLLGQGTGGSEKVC